MPAINPRISVTVQPSVDAVLSRIAFLTKQSKSALIAELLDSSMPLFERMAVVLQAATAAKDTLKAKALFDLEEGERKLQELLGVTMDIFDEHTLPILQHAEQIKRRSRQPAPAPAQAQRLPAAQAVLPPHVTRGSGTPNKGRGATADKDKSIADRSACTCTHTKHERMEDKDCLVHFPAKKLFKRPPELSKRKVKG